MKTAATAQRPVVLRLDRSATATDIPSVRTKDRPAIQEGTSLLRSIWDNSLVGMRLTNLAGEMVAVNREFCAIVGKTEKELIGKPFTAIYSTDADVEALLERYRNRFRRDTFASAMEKSLVLWTGKEIAFHVQSSFVVSDEGERLLLSIFRDVTDAKRTEQALRASEQKLRAVYDNVRDVIFIVTRDGIVESINREFERLTGWSAGEWTGQSFHPIIHPDDLRKAWLSFREAVKGGTESVTELRVRTKDGQYLTGEFTWSPQVLHGRLEQVLGCVRDVTKRRNMETQLRESERRFRELFENSLQPMFQSTVGGSLINANKAFLKAFGYGSLTELAEVNLSSLYVHPEQRAEVADRLAQHGFLSNFELDLRKKDGAVMTVVENSLALRNAGGEIIGYEGILEDVTVRRSMEVKLKEYVAALEESQRALGELNAQKDTLFSVLSHDLRSPFASILGFCEVLLEEGEKLTEAERRQFTSYIMESAQDQLALVNKLLDWSRLETGRIRLDTTDLNLAQVCERSISSLMGLAIRKKVTITSALPDHVPVRGDNQLLQNVFCNLIGNALKFTPAGGSIIVEFKARSVGTITIGVSDTGVGIPATDLPRLFRIEEKYTRPGLEGEKGTGFGLPLCAEIMQKHGGSISAESRPGEGTTMLVTFVSAEPAEGIRVLIVDDDAGARVLHSRYVKRSIPGAVISQASNGREGIDAATRLRPQLIISDYAMPTMNGFEMIRQLKRDPSLASIPVIVVTGEDSRASRDAMTLEGAADVFLKPVAAKEFEEVVRLHAGIS